MSGYDELPLDEGCCGGACTCRPSDGRVAVYIRAGDFDEIEVGRLGAASELPDYLRDLAEYLESTQARRHSDDADEQ